MARTATIVLHSGNTFDFLNPDVESFTIEDIAHALGQLCRFNGHTTKFYSVAQHLVLSSFLVPKEHALAALLHDAHEAFVGDVVTPLKLLLPDFKKIEDHIEEIVLAKFGLPFPLDPCVKHADLKMLCTEKRDLLAHPESVNWTSLAGIEPMSIKIDPMNPVEATYAFIERFYELYNKA